MKRRNFLQGLAFVSIPWVGCAPKKATHQPLPTPAPTSKEAPLPQETLKPPAPIAEEAPPPKPTPAPKAIVPSADGRGVFAKAILRGKPLLVFVAPDSGVEREAYRELVSLATDEELTLLSMCEIVYAHARSIRPYCPEVKDADWMVLLETDGATPQATRLSPSASGEWPMRALREALLSDELTQQRRITQSLAALTPEEQKKLAAYLKSPKKSPDVELAGRGAALILQEAERPSTTKENRQALLKAGAKNSRLRLSLLFSPGTFFDMIEAQPPPKKAKKKTKKDLLREKVERAEAACYSCGMGSVLKTSGDFLGYYSESLNYVTYTQPVELR